MTNSRKKARAAARAKADAAYRRTLGVKSGEALPREIGQASSAGAGRGGRGAAQKGNGRQS